MATLDGPAKNLRKRKSIPVLETARVSSSHLEMRDRSNGWPTEHGREVDRQMEEHYTSVSETIREHWWHVLTSTRYEFGGPKGVSAIMIGFPVLMC